MSIKLKDPSDLYYHDLEKVKMEDKYEEIDVKMEPKVGPIKKKRSPATLNILCPICGGPAPDHVHFGGQCCYSCRAFFRRTSVKPMSSHRCRSGKNDCVISSGIKSCIPCRLNKCLQVGMDPSLVKGKKTKSDNSEQSKLHENYGDYDEPNYETRETDLNSSFESEKMPSSPPPQLGMYSSNNNIGSTPFYNTGEQESLLRYRAEILKYQGMCLQQRANILENEAKRRMMEKHQQYAFVQTIRYSPYFGYGNHNQNVFKNQDILTNQSPINEPETSEYETKLHEYEYQENYSEKENDLSDRKEFNDFTDDKEEDQEDQDNPLDLTMKKTQSNLHTQASNMPRIFFSLNSNKNENCLSSC